MTRQRSERRTASLSPDAGCIGDFLPTPVTGARQLSTTTPSLAPAGDLTGVPAAQYGSGRFQFESKILVLGVEPQLDAAGFQARLQSAFGQLVPGVTVISARIAKGAPESVQVPRVRGMPMTAVTPKRSVDGWWLGVTGEINSSGFAVNGAAGFNRALARAVAQSVAFHGFVDADYRAVIPTDGATLDAQFRSGAACSGGFNPEAVYARACTRFAGAGSAQPAAPAAPGAPPAAPPGGVELPNAGTTCAIRIQTKMFLRPTATFATKNAAGQNYPEIAAGTAVTVTGPKLSQQGALGLYPVSVAGRAGFGALNAADFVGCTLFAGPGGTSTSGTSTSTARPASSTSTTPPAQRYPGLAMLDTGATSTSTYVYGAVAFLAVLALGGAALYAHRASKRSEARGHAHPKHNGRRSRRGGRRSRRAR